MRIAPWSEDDRDLLRQFNAPEIRQHTGGPEEHTGSSTRTTDFTYQGLSTLATEEKQTGGTDPRTKTFSYDSYGHRISMTDKPTGSTADPDKYTYGVDAHTSVSQLIDDAGKVKASYGYDAYGGTDSSGSDPQSLTTGDTNSLNPINPYRFSGKRMDTGTVSTGSTTSPVPNGSGGYDLGARRYGPDIAGFIQQDMYQGALSNLGLALDPLTQNRYAMAGGNPISYIETDGHEVTFDGTGGGSATANPTPAPSDDEKESQGGVEGLKRFVGALGGEAKQSRDGLVQLDKKLDACNYEDDKAACDQLHDQYLTKEGWKQNLNSMKEPFEKDGNPSANRAPECAAHTATALLELVGGKGAGKLRTGARACSFTGETEVLMADGTRKPISEVKVGDEVIATDPETGEQEARTVTALWVHDDSVIGLDINGDSVTTTEDHPFWNATDQQWQRADQLDPGDRILTADGRTVPVNGLRLGTRHDATAYNLTVEDIHTYYVVAGETSVLVHNSGGVPTGLKTASPGLKSIYADGGVRGKSMIGIRSKLMDQGFTQGLTKNKKGFLLQNSAGEQVRFMRRQGQWHIRVQNAQGNNLDEFGNVAPPSQTHDIQIYSQ